MCGSSRLGSSGNRDIAKKKLGSLGKKMNVWEEQRSGIIYKRACDQELKGALSTFSICHTAGNRSCRDDCSSWAMLLV